MGIDLDLVDNATQFAFGGSARERESCGSSDTLNLGSPVGELERRLARSNLHSPKFWSRAFAVLGHQFSAVFAIYAVVFVIALIVVLVAAMIGGLTR